MTVRSVRRAKLIAEALFDLPRLVNEVRGSLGYTGTVGGTTEVGDGVRHGCPSITVQSESIVLDGLTVADVGEFGQAGSQRIQRGR